MLPELAPAIFLGIDGNDTLYEQKFESACFFNTQFRTIYFQNVILSLDALTVQ